MYLFLLSYVRHAKNIRTSPQKLTYDNTDLMVRFERKVEAISLCECRMWQRRSSKKHARNLGKSIVCWHTKQMFALRRDEKRKDAPILTHPFVITLTTKTIILFLCLLNSCLCGCHSCNRHTERTATYIIETYLVAEFNR